MELTNVPLPNLTDEDEIDRPPTDADKQARVQYLQRLSQKEHPKPKRRWPLIAAIAVALLVAGGGAYLLLSQNKNAPVKTKKTVSTQNGTVVPTTDKMSAGTTTYVSKGTDLNLTFDYPSNWTVTPVSGDNSNDQTITLNSPLVTMTGSAGNSTTGKVTVTIRPSSAGLSELSSGSATAAQNSEQIAYAKPTSVQYQYPFLAFIHLTGGAKPTGGFEEVIVSGNTTFNKGDAITQDSLSPDPIISAKFYTCTTAACTGSSATALSITNDTWTNSDVCKQTLALLESLQIQ